MLSYRYNQREHCAPHSYNNEESYRAAYTRSHSRSRAKRVRTCFIDPEEPDDRFEPSREKRHRHTIEDYNGSRRRCSTHLDRSNNPAMPAGPVPQSRRHRYSNSSRQEVYSHHPHRLASPITQHCTGSPQMPPSRSPSGCRRPPLQQSATPSYDSYEMNCRNSSRYRRSSSSVLMNRHSDVQERSPLRLSGGSRWTSAERCTPRRSLSQPCRQVSLVVPDVADSNLERPGRKSRSIHYPRHSSHLDDSASRPRQQPYRQYSPRNAECPCRPSPQQRQRCSVSRGYRGRDYRSRNHDRHYRSRRPSPARIVSYSSESRPPRQLPPKSRRLGRRGPNGTAMRGACRYWFERQNRQQLLRRQRGIAAEDESGRHYSHRRSGQAEYRRGNFQSSRRISSSSWKSLGTRPDGPIDNRRGHEDHYVDRYDDDAPCHDQRDPRQTDECRYCSEHYERGDARREKQEWREREPVPSAGYVGHHREVIWISSGSRECFDRSCKAGRPDGYYEAFDYSQNQQAVGSRSSGKHCKSGKNDDEIVHFEWYVGVASIVCLWLHRYDSLFLFPFKCFCVVHRLPGMKLGRRFVVVSQLGEGTFGRVVECHDTETGKRVAVKVCVCRGASRML